MREKVLWEGLNIAADDKGILAITGVCVCVCGSDGGGGDLRVLRGAREVATMSSSGLGGSTTWCRDWRRKLDVYCGDCRKLGRGRG